MYLDWVIQFLTLYLPLINIFGLPPLFFINKKLFGILVSLAYLSTKLSVKSPYIHRICSSIIKPHDSLVNPFEIYGDISSITKEQYAKSIIMVTPHGPTLYPLVYLGLCLKENSVYRVPYSSMVMSTLWDMGKVDPKTSLNLCGVIE